MIEKLNRVLAPSGSIWPVCFGYNFQNSSRLTFFNFLAAWFVFWRFQSRFYRLHFKFAECIREANFRTNDYDFQCNKQIESESQSIYREYFYINCEKITSKLRAYMKRNYVYFNIMCSQCRRPANDTVTETINRMNFVFGNKKSAETVFCGVVKRQI